MKRNVPKTSLSRKLKEFAKETFSNFRTVNNIYCTEKERKLGGGGGGGHHNPSDLISFFIVLVSTCSSRFLVIWISEDQGHAYILLALYIACLIHRLNYVDNDKKKKT